MEKQKVFILSKLEISESFDQISLNSSIHSEPSATFILNHPRGAYSTARTVHQKNILELELHVKRLTDSTREIFKLKPEILSYDKTRELLLPVLRLAISDFLKETQTENDMKLTILFTSEDDKRFSLYTHVTDLPSPPSSCIVEIRTAHREKPTVKDTDWVRNRKSLEEAKAPDANEVVLRDEKGLLYEGTQTNFFAIHKEGYLITAGDDFVLSGSIRKVVLDVCNQQNIPVKLQLPDSNDIDSWQSAFITSTSRLALPIHTIRFPEDKGKAEHHFKESPLLSSIAKFISQELNEHSTKIIT